MWHTISIKSGVS